MLKAVGNYIYRYILESNLFEFIGLCQLIIHPLLMPILGITWLGIFFTLGGGIMFLSLFSRRMWKKRAFRRIMG